jgi:adenylate cyclase
LKIDESLPEAHAMIAALRAVDYDWKGAEHEFQRALELDPESATVWESCDFYYLVPMRRLDDAITASRRALALDPLSTFTHWRLGLRYYYAQQWDRAAEQFHNALELDSHYWPAYWSLVPIYLRAGKLEEALGAMEMEAQILGRSSHALALLCWANALAGRTDEALKLLAERHELSQKTYVAPFPFAAIYTALGEIDEAFDWLEKAIDDRDGLIIHLSVDPGFDLLHSDPRYNALLRKMNLES